MAPIQCGKLHRCSKSAAIGSQSSSVKEGGRTTGHNIFQSTSHVSDIMLLIVVYPNKYWYDIDIIESPEAKYLYVKDNS